MNSGPGIREDSALDTLLKKYGIKNQQLPVATEPHSTILRKEAKDEIKNLMMVTFAKAVERWTSGNKVGPTIDRAFADEVDKL